MTSSSSSCSRPMGLRITTPGTSRLKTDEVDIEVASFADRTGTGLKWSLSHFRSQGPDAVEVQSERAAEYVFTQVPLAGTFEAELNCGTQYDGATAGLIRPKESSALFRFNHSDNAMFGVLLPLTVLEQWFGGDVPKGARDLLRRVGSATLHRPSPLPLYLRQMLVSSLENQSPLRHHLVEAAAIQVMGFQIDQLTAFGAPTFLPHELQAAREAQAIMQANAMAPPNARDLAASLGISANRLANAYREVFNCTLAQGAAQIRLQAACGALQAGASIKVVALQAGYSSASSFTYAFRKQLGLPPREWLNARARRSK
ncbi:helix-turn-helix domain-containing protein [Pseudovibrio exalbescens]|uniref:helix-turn-helix domain-containing protein n=1 Tax=Pseudovibrio exalbescens TaxID=197461 RepID=UPI0009DC02DE|nr:AraC family transcriptional regulator [Pseudovibrio exalbescens]